ncbi:MAG: hypothetical protein IJ428_03185 [Clostridia bacterium]|nr:hypothetical protein [Clostridia bacterium]
MYETIYEKKYPTRRWQICGDKITDKKYDLEKFNSLPEYLSPNTFGACDSVCRSGDENFIKIVKQIARENRLTIRINRHASFIRAEFYLEFFSSLMFLRPLIVFVNNILLLPGDDKYKVVIAVDYHLYISLSGGKPRETE